MRATTRYRYLPAAAAAVLLLAGCGAGQDPTTGPPDGDDPDAGVTVDIVDNDFSPDSIEVAVGDTVVWTNTGEVDHTVTFDEGGPDSGTMQPEATSSNTFGEAGEFSYVCTIHPTMQGTVTVTE